MRDVVSRIEQLDPAWIHGMHGGSLARETIPDFVRALRDEPFAFQGMVLGRELGVVAVLGQPLRGLERLLGLDGEAVWIQILSPLRHKS